jgi:predicted Zn-dependent protease
MRLLRSGERKLSSKFSLYEDFSGGRSPRFNHEGELAPERMPLIESGQLSNSLVNSRSAKEYGVNSNGAGPHENLRSPAMAPGTLCEIDVLATLGTGLYLSNLHYLNWSDRPGGRITGMTRFACFWVEGGKIVSPIENMRFDDTLFDLFGDSLAEVLERRTDIPETLTYGMRQLGGASVPGMLVSKMSFTL